MTCKEKLIKDHPNWDTEYVHFVIEHGSCPGHFGYAPYKGGDACDNATSCDECWNRDVMDDEHPHKKLTKPSGIIPEYSLVDEICEARKKFIDVGFSSHEAFNPVWDIFKGRWKYV